MKLLALDIGGANIKVATGLDFAQSYPFPLWRFPEQLAQRLNQIIAVAPVCEFVVATMTGELADCFQTKRQGVVSIVDALLDAVRGRRVGIYLTDGAIVSPSRAKDQYRLAAASNWHALGKFTARFAQRGNALVVDIGSTTCDVISIVNGRLAAQGKTDTERLMAGELIYAGVERTPVCSIISSTAYRGRRCPLARELFATMKDVYLILSDIDEDATDTDTADGRPATQKAATTRLGRCLGADVDDFNLEDAKVIAETAATSQANLLWEAIQSVSARSGLSGTPRVVLSGHGDFLFDRMTTAIGYEPSSILRLVDEIGARAARCAPAHALATIAAEVLTVGEGLVKK